MWLRTVPSLALCLFMWFYSRWRWLQREADMRSPLRKGRESHTRWELERARWAWLFFRRCWTCVEILLRKFIISREIIDTDSSFLRVRIRWKQNNVITNDLCFVSFHSLGVIPCASLEMSFDIYLLSLLGVFFHDVSESAPCDNIVVFDFFLKLVLLVFPLSVRGNWKSRDFLTIRSLADFCICSHVSYDLDLVQRIAHVWEKLLNLNTSIIQKIHWKQIFLSKKPLFFRVDLLCENEWIRNESLTLHPVSLLSEWHIRPVFRSKLFPVLWIDGSEHFSFFESFWVYWFHKSEKKILNFAWHTYNDDKPKLNFGFLLCYDSELILFSRDISDTPSIQLSTHSREQNSCLSLSWNALNGFACLRFDLQYAQ